MLLAAMLLLLTARVGATGFDHRHAAWTTLLERHVHWNADGRNSVVDYGGFAGDRDALSGYLDVLSAVPVEAYEGWSEAQRTAFLVNAYNAFTVELVLTRWPALDSIRDIGGLFSGPWKREFFELLGESRSLDEVEHGLLRGADGYREPRIHFAVNCASVGCPALRPEAFVADRLEVQLEDQTRRFLSDRSRNRFEGNSRLLVSPIFDWYAQDFERHAGGVLSFLARYPDALAKTPAQRRALEAGKLELDYSDYDWALNTSATAR